MIRSSAPLAAVAIFLAACGSSGSESTGHSVSRAALVACVQQTGAIYRADGQLPDELRASVDLREATYVGVVIFPTKHVADIYVSTSADQAKKAERKIQDFYTPAGGTRGEDELVQRRANVVVLLDPKATPTPPEAQSIYRCTN